MAILSQEEIKTVIAESQRDARFYILALSQKSIRLLECSRAQVQEVPLPHVPKSMDEALPDGPAPQLQRHTLPMDARNASWFHGHGVGTDDVDVINLTRYFHRVHDGVEEILKHQHAPLVLGCVEYLAPLYKEVCTYRHILETIVAGNPDGVKNEELHQEAWTIVEPHLAQAQAQAAAQYHEGVAKGRASHSLTDILAAAYQGRVATLFVPLGSGDGAVSTLRPSPWKSTTVNSQETARCWTSPGCKH
jgi:hypothetical protein